MRLPRFSIKTALLVTTVAAIAFFAQLAYEDYLKAAQLRKTQAQLREIRSHFLHWAKATDRSDGKIHAYHNLNVPINNGTGPKGQPGTLFLVANTVIDYRRRQSPELVHDVTFDHPDPKRFYVLPSRKWVNSADAVIREWNAWHQIEY